MKPFSEIVSRIKLKSVAIYGLAFVMAFSAMFSLVLAISSSRDYKEPTASTLKTAEFLANAKGDAKDDELVTIMVQLDDPCIMELSDSVRGGVNAYRAQIQSAQKNSVAQLSKTLGISIPVKSAYALIFNGFSFTGKAGLIDEINQIGGYTAFRSPEFDSPEPMVSSGTGLVGANAAWELGYTGKGSAVAVLDTGIRSSHEAFSVSPDSPKYTSEVLSDIIKEYGDLMHATGEVSDIYKSGKIPFGWDYKYADADVEHSANDHGTHVAGITAGNNGKAFKGVACDAQIVVMQVFANEGGCSWDDVLCALEDCAYLGVDSINMSLGSDAGFTSYPDESYEKVYELLAKAGCNVAAAAGNAGTAADGNAIDGYALAANPDYGLVSSPSTYAGAVSVASSSNAILTGASITVGDKEFGYTDPFVSTEISFEKFAGEHEYVMCGLGAEADFTGKDLTGKFAIISRGEGTFTSKAANALAAGAIGAIIYNNIEGVLNMSVESTIPVVSILQRYGQTFAENADANGCGTFVITEKEFYDMTSANQISSFSGRGTTADLKIKPEITAPGGGIISSIGLENDDSYAKWDGTSMSTPFISGGMTIIKEYVKNKFPDASKDEIRIISNALLMCCATPMETTSVRAQGAGIMNLSNALSASAYLSVSGCDRPKIELGENSDGEFTFTFTVNNFGSQEITYTIDTTVLSDTPVELGTIGETVVYGVKDIAMDITEDTEITSESSITVPGGASKEITVSIKASSDLKDFFNTYFTSGAYMEGFVKLTPNAYGDGSKDAVLSIPFLGFCGDWDYASMLDRGYYWQDATGEMNLSTSLTVPYNYIGSNGGEGTAVGLNPFGMSMEGHEFNPDWGAISPNGDGINDYVDYIQFTLLRNARMVYYKVEQEGKEDVILYESDKNAWRKDFIVGDQFTYCDLNALFDGEGMQENESVNLVLETWLDHDDYSPENNESGIWSTKVTYDTIAPLVEIDGKNINVTDTNYVAYIGFYTDGTLEHLVSEESRIGVFEKERGVTTTVKDYTGTVYMFAGDYAGNGKGYAIDMDNKTITELEANPFRVVDDPRQIVWEETWEDENTYQFWETIDNDGDTFEWSIMSDAPYAHKGNSFAGSASWDSTSENGLTPDNWLISKAVTVPKNENIYTISFYMATMDYDEAFEFLIGDASASKPEDFKAVITEKPFSNATYTEYTFDLTEYSGKTIKFAWRHNGCKDGYMLRLDTIALYTIPYKPNYGELLYSESFESQNPLGWTFIDNDGDTHNWEQTTSLAAYDGRGLLYSESYSNDFGTLKPDNWAISPEITIPFDATSATLSFCTGAVDAQYYWEHYGVFIGTGTDVSTYTEVFSEKLTSVQWGIKAVDLSSYIGKTVSIAFRHYESTDVYILTLDNVEVFFDTGDAYTLTYYIDDEVFLTEKHAAGEVLTPAEVPEKEGFIFNGWSGLPTYMPAEDISVYGSYTAKKYTVTFIDGIDRSVIATQEVSYGEVVKDFPTPPEHTGYVFISWDYNNTPIVQNTEIVANYKEGQLSSGDVNGDGKTDSGDAALILSYLLELGDLTPEQLTIADVNGNGKVNSGDAANILIRLMGD